MSSIVKNIIIIFIKLLEIFQENLGYLKMFEFFLNKHFETWKKQMFG